MVKNKQELLSRFKELQINISNKKFSPFYIFMGEEPYYTDILVDLLIKNVLIESEKDFNQHIYYANDIAAEQVASLAGEFPMMAKHQLIIVKEAQNFKKLDVFDKYLDDMVDSTILVLCFTNSNVDKRTNFYKHAIKKTCIFKSDSLKEEDVPSWIEKYITSAGREIEPKAAVLMANFLGTELRKIVLEIDKLFKNTDKIITGEDIEKNIGISRTFNAPELAEALALRNAEKAYKIGVYLSMDAKQYIQNISAYLFYFFSKVEIMKAAMINMGSLPSLDNAAKQAGIFWKYSTPFKNACKNYNLIQTMKIISHIRVCDYSTKSNARGNATDADLINDLIANILNV
ncbi:MAG: DNA polymerase III subunit delta [Bacteroidales bacterium]